ncbi:MAG: serine/threonine protein kinase [Muribaculaceae bacterium]|nr:serine/threonine protein kinase [Muribaculaceae bacterium]
MAIITIQGAEEKRLKIHYEVDTSLAPIGAGGMGQVMRGMRVDETTGVKRPAAIKFMFDDLPESAIERTRREASVQIKNENLVEMFGFIEVETTDAAGAVHKRYHVASELLTGVMLHDLMRGKTTDADGNEMPFAREIYRQYSCERMRFATFIISKLLLGVMALHDAGYIHRDIDPSNVMITADGKVKLIDFGICKKLDELGSSDRHLTTAGQFMGKAAYAAPELVMGDVAHQDPTTDLYAIGIMLFELITGKVPFEGATHEVLARQLKEKVNVKEIADKTMRAIILKATAKKQNERYASAAEFRVALEQFTRSSIVPSAGHTGRTNPGTSTPAVVAAAGMDDKKKKLLIYGGVAAAVAVIIGCAVTFMSSKNSEAEAQAAAELHERVEARRAEIADLILDSSEVTSELDSLTGMEIPTAGLLIRQARLQLASASTAGDGVATLRKVADKKMHSSAEALALLAALNSRSSALDPAILTATESIFTQRDYQEAHRLNQTALSLDSANYKALYEVALDYMAGDSRGIVERDLNKTATMLRKARKIASDAGDNEFVRIIDAPLGQLKQAGVLKD